MAGILNMSPGHSFVAVGRCRSVALRGRSSQAAAAAPSSIHLARNSPAGVNAVKQVAHGAVGGIGMALTEEVMIDTRYGRYTNANLADYHVPVNADAPPMEIVFVNKADNIISPTGAKGIGEIALVGVAPAIANAVFNATGKRIRQLPITPDKLI